MHNFVSFKEAFGDARWIAPQNTDICPLIRRDFDVAELESATIDIVGFSTFVFYVNGRLGSEDLFQPMSTNFEHRDFPKGEITVSRGQSEKKYSVSRGFTALTQGSAESS